MDGNEPMDKGRRKVLAALGAAGISLAAAPLLASRTGNAENVSQSVYGPGGNGDPLQCCNDVVNVCEFGAIGDGSSHPLSESYSTLAEAQAVYPHVTALTDETDWAAIQAALNTGKNVFVPGGNYSINQTIAIRIQGQQLYGKGTYTTTLTWNAVDSTKNMIEILSMRRDTGLLHLAKTGQVLSGFFLTTTNEAVMAHTIWMEDGVFHSIVEQVRIVLPGFVAQAVIRTSTGNGYAYPVGSVFRDITITAYPNLTGNPIPVGVWLEGMIEGLFENVKVYSTEVGWRFGAITAEASFNVEECTFIRCQSEIGNRGNATDAGIAVEFYEGTNMNFYGCKFTAGASFTTFNGQRVMTFANVTDSIWRSINFYSTFFWHINGTGPAIQFLESALFRDVHFTNPSLNCQFGVISIDPQTDVNISWENPTYISTVPKVADFRVRGVNFPAATIASGAFQAVTLPDIQFPRGGPFLLSYSGDLQGALLTGYRTSGPRNGTASIQNVTDTSVGLEAGRIRWREFSEAEIKSRIVVLFDPSLLAPGASASMDVACPDAAMNDMVAVGFAAESGGLRNMILTGYVSSPGIVTARLTNLTTVSFDFPAAELIVHVLAPKFAAYNTAAVGPLQIADGSGTTVSVSVPGIQTGDFPVASFSENIKGLIVGANVSSAGNVSVRLQNHTGSAVNLALGTLAVGIYRRYSTM